MRYLIYRITFEDGAQYVGQTKVQPLKSGKMRSDEQAVAIRINKHKIHPANWELSVRLGTEPYTAEVVSSHSRRDGADTAERAAIAKLEKPINKYWTGYKKERAIKHTPCNVVSSYQYGQMRTFAHTKKKSKRRKYKRCLDTERYRCRICFVTQLAVNFHTDRNRSCGIGSKCKSCQKRLQYAINAANAIMLKEGRTLGTDASKAYYKTIEEIRNGNNQDTQGRDKGKHSTHKEERGDSGKDATA